MRVRRFMMTLSHTPSSSLDRDAGVLLIHSKVTLELLAVVGRAMLLFVTIETRKKDRLRDGERTVCVCFTA